MSYTERHQKVAQRAFLGVVLLISGIHSQKRPSPVANAHVKSPYPNQKPMQETRLPTPMRRGRCYTSLLALHMDHDSLRSPH